MIIDIHTHAFPDSIAEHAVPFLQEAGDVKAHLDGKMSSLVESMNRSGIDISVVVSIATKPAQFRPILEWSKSISSERIIPFPSVHPDDPAMVDQVEEISRSGFRGLKLHPYYQNFAIDEPRLNGLYKQAERDGLVVLMHAGFDMVYPRDRIADPKRIDSVLHRFPGLKMIAAHFGSWEDWDEVDKYLIGGNAYLDTSYSIPFLGAERAKEMIGKHGHDRVLFGSDSPWADQNADVETIRELGLDEASTARLLGGNAAKLLNLRT
jgi:uncharacterized protein